jgi:hypothetical protein
MISEKILGEEAKHLEMVQCDGATRILHYRLTLAGIKHTVYVGKVLFKNEVAIRLHFWIVLDNNNIIDTKARSWTNNSAPYGIFNPDHYPDYKYRGSPVHITYAGNSIPI